MILLNQVIALVKGEKSRAENAFTVAYHSTKKVDVLNGISRTYEPKDDDGDRYPSEGNFVQVKSQSLLDAVTKALSRLFDLTATLENGNTGARADVVVDGDRVLQQVPVTYLLFLEKKLVDLTTFIRSLPILDPSIKWTFDEGLGVFRSEPVQTIKSKKVPRNHVKAEATERHPAQVDVYQEDILVGYWTTTKYSGAMEQSRVNELLARVVKLSDAVKAAREQANSQEVEEFRVSDAIFGYLFR